MKRKFGVLMPIASLPSSMGIGSIGEPAYRFINWLKDAGLIYQVNRIKKPDLPLIAYQDLNAFKLSISFFPSYFILYKSTQPSMWG